MTDYNEILATETDPDAPLRSSLFKRMVANPIALAEGAPGAPRIQFDAMDPSFSTAGGLGSYVLARRGTGTGAVAFGSTLAGSNLVPTTVAYSVPAGVTGSAATFPSGSALSGTWRCMGEFTHQAAFGSGGSLTGATLWLRIA